MSILRWWTSVLVVLVTSNGAAWAQGATDWPNKTVRMIVNFGPGGSTDNAMRPFAERLSQALGQQFVIENRGGASGAVGIEGAVKSAPDGYTFVATPALTVVIVPHLRKTAYDPFKDLMPVSAFTEGTLLIAVRPSIPANTVQELVAHAKQNPGKLSWGTAGIGSMGHITSEIFKQETGTDILHVPYRGGGESLADFLAGIHQIHVDPNTFPHIAAGKAKLLAVIDRRRHPDYPNVPMLKEIYPEIDFIGWFGIFAPAGTPEPIVRKFNAELNKIAAQPDLKPLLAKLALSAYPNSPEDFGKLLRKDYDQFGALIKKLNIKSE